MISTIFFDIDGTLLDFKAAEHAAFCKSMKQHGITDGESRYPRYTVFNRGLWEALERGEITKDQLLDHRYEQFFAMEQLSVDPKAFEASYRANLNEVHVLMEGAVEILDYLHGKYPMYVVTNGIAETQHRRLADSGIDRYFDGIFISEEIGFSKPDPKFFEYTLSRAGNPSPENVIIIGDSLTSDMLGGINAGFRTCWFLGQNPDGVSKYPVDHDITDLAELRNIL